MDWKPITTAPTDGTGVIARDRYGDERWTWFAFGDWIYLGWRENADQDGYECEEIWSPIEWA